MAQVAEMLKDADNANLFLDELAHTTAELGRIMAREAEALRDMQIKEVEKLQHAKGRLTDRLEKMKEMSAEVPGWIASCDPELVEEFENVTEIFGDIVKENYKQLQVARKVNGIVMQVVRDSAKEQNASMHYDGKGHDGNHKHAWTLSLNEVI